MEKAKVLKNGNKKCSTCGGILVYSPSDRALRCLECDNVYPIEASKDIKKHDYSDSADSVRAVDEWEAQNKVMKCSNCGAAIVLNKLEYSKSCPYCSSPNVSPSKELPGLKPDAVVPFMFDKNAAREHFRANVKRRWFLPNKFKKSLPKAQLAGTYCTAFSFDAKTRSSYRGTLSYTVRVRDRNGGYRTETRHKFVSGTIDLSFDNITIESSSHITQSEYSQIKPFDYSGSVAFNEDYLRGFVVEHYDTGLRECNEQMEAYATGVIKNRILSKHGCSGIVSLNLNTNYIEKKYCYRLLPVYFFDYTYKKKSYRTVMNGQTGKLGTNLPRSGVKITFFVLMILAIIGGIIFLSVYFGMT